ncbi:hypothetical protein GCM10009687_76980 [Asanoa iriomotensis]|uniref:Uncharacterized protein n=1 Tax=Asanoa iriomotensis TaxID=234613 RepID=A0ABQ4CAB0_9ACTN|nr:hypothetical protein Air01nite_57790 [Asanoa iriomotensis]
MPAGAGQGRVEIARPDLAAGVGDAGHRDVGGGHSRPDQGRQVGEPDGSDGAWARIAGHGVRPYPVGARLPHTHADLRLIYGKAVYFGADLVLGGTR